MLIPRIPRIPFPVPVLERLHWKTPALQALNFIKMRLQDKCFPVKFLRTHFSTEQLRRVLFKISNSNNLFKYVSAISLTHNQYLIIYSSHKLHFAITSSNYNTPCITTSPFIYYFHYI